MVIVQTADFKHAKWEVLKRVQTQSGTPAEEGPQCLPRGDRFTTWASRYKHEHSRMNKVLVIITPKECSSVSSRTGW